MQDIKARASLSVSAQRRYFFYKENILYRKGKGVFHVAGVVSAMKTPLLF